MAGKGIPGRFGALALAVVILIVIAIMLGEREGGSLLERATNDLANPSTEARPSVEPAEPKPAEPDLNPAEPAAPVEFLDDEALIDPAHGNPATGIAPQPLDPDGIDPEGIAPEGIEPAPDHTPDPVLGDPDAG